MKDGYEEFAREFAEQSSISAAQAVLHRWREATGNCEDGVPPQASVSEETQPRIGIWRRCELNGEVWFNRGKDPDAGHWSQVERIGPKRHRKRIVLIGESVARGWGYDPLFNCSSALATFVDSVPGGSECEVVDIARNGLTFSQLWELLQSSLQLEPDFFVIFAGNNWQVADSGALEVDRLGEIIEKTADWSNVAVYVEELLRQRVASLLSAIGRLSRAQRIPVVWVIPEFNLGDWRHIPNQLHTPLLGSAEAIRRKEACQLADAALAAGDFARVTELAEEMRELEQGSSPNSSQLLGRCAQSRGDLRQSRCLYEAARDATLSLPIRNDPACYSVIQSELRTRGASEGLYVVDLPRCLSVASGGAIPDRRLFLDCVHLTVEGICIAMAAVAEKLLPLLNKPAYSQSRLLETPPKVCSRAKAQAHFTAAFINTLREQDSEVVRYHCNAAARSAPEILPLMELVVECKLRRAPDVLCQAFYQLQELGPIFPGIIQNLPRSATGRKALNLPLVQMLTETIAAAKSNAYGRYAELLRQEHQLSPEHSDLLHPSCRWMSWSVWEHPAYMVADSPESEFRFFCEPVGPLLLRLTSRVIKPMAATKMSLLVNGTVVGLWSTDSNWQTTEFFVDKNVLREGFNTAVICWPDPGETRLDRMREIRRLLETPPLTESRSFPNLYLRYGEVHSFDVLTHGHGSLEHCECR
jgi:hypothetical protein